MAPGIRGTNLDGQSVDLYSLRGKPTMLVFWASWCGPCVAEAPQIAAVAESYGERIHVLGINAGEPASTVRAATSRMQIAWPVLIDGDGLVAKRYAVTGIPLVLVIDGDGRVRHRNNGLPSEIHRLLDGLIQ